ncbi:MAG TPA: peptidylprolyl isomerase [Dehalococcoidia bacterium]
MAKKQKKTTPERAPTKHQLSKWQRQMKIRRILIIAAIVFFVGIGSWVGYESYADYRASTAAWREVVIEVNGVPFAMEYFVEMLDIYTKDMDSQLLTQWAEYIGGMVADEVIKAELVKQGAKNLGIEVTPGEIDVGLTEREWPNERVYRDIVCAALLQGKLEAYFGSNLTDTMEQAHVQVTLVESEEVAGEVITKVEAGGNFTALAEEYSRNSTVKGDLGWLPRELMPNTLIADVAFNLTPGEISQPIYDETAITNNSTTGGYWLVKVVDRGERALENETKEDLVAKYLNDWLKEWREDSTIENLLDKAKKTWAISEVLKGR